MSPTAQLNINSTECHSQLLMFTVTKPLTPDQVIVLKLELATFSLLNKHHNKQSTKFLSVVAEGNSQRLSVKLLWWYMVMNIEIPIRVNMKRIRGFVLLSSKGNISITPLTPLAHVSLKKISGKFVKAKVVEALGKKYLLGMSCPLNKWTYSYYK